MKIVLSGGWGYGNLGDDAILDSTIQQLKLAFPGACFTVLSYDLVDSAEHKSASVALVNGVHHFTDGQGCKVFIPELGTYESVGGRFFSRLRFNVSESVFWFNKRLGSVGAKGVLSEISSADLFVMAGGGYFNEKWKNKTRAQLCEMRIAADSNIPIFVLGPTIGSFIGPISEQARYCFSRASLVTVRDEFSYQESIKWNPCVQLVPDIALSTWLSDYQRRSGIGVVLTTQSISLRRDVAAGVAQLVKSDARFQAPVKLFLTRRWRYDLSAALSFQSELRAFGVDSQIIVSTSFRDVEKGLASCELVVSENLHGLILAARNAVPFVAVNDYPVGSPNFKKFHAFLAQSGLPNSFINSKSGSTGVLSALESIAADSDRASKALVALRHDVRNSYQELLSKGL